jgi:hypothetical protein
MGRSSGSLPPAPVQQSCQRQAGRVTAPNRLDRHVRAWERAVAELRGHLKHWPAGFGHPTKIANDLAHAEYRLAAARREAR